MQGEEVLIKRLGSAVVLLPKDDSWQAMFDALALDVALVTNKLREFSRMERLRVEQWN